MSPDGWFVDPFGHHGVRWFSGGRPTSLVRDGRQESRDEPPGDTFDGPLVPLDGAEAEGGEDLLRADDGERPLDGDDYSRAAWDAFGATGGSFT